ncbi:hypothetical protein GCM10011390_27890 [Aureimonas endophytica]|uniref:Blue-light-activated histidine kinase n=1 Tax=Aureimonas endophytica TaxID=2027858 RepID=A0A916ZR12_9HYPH|nr:HWE histidine kinase domain-containing protein [Aureimonas endophytica]GGE07252.1 hypothetical protein GCM10011390_27890 [Aureimonas endophytica]
MASGSPISSGPLRVLPSRLQELEAENARLRARLDARGPESDARAGFAGPSPAEAPLDPVAAAALRARLLVNEERLAFAFEASGSIGWWDWDIAADQLYTSAQFARMFGVEPEAAAKGVALSRFIDGIHPDDREWVGARIAEVIAAGGEFAEEYRLLHRDGEVSWIFARGRGYLDAAGRAIRFPGVAVDVTQRKLSDMRKSALVELGDRLRESNSLEHIAYTAAEVMARALGATRAGIGTIDHLNETVVMQPDWRAPGVASVAGLHHFRDYGSFIDDLKRGEAVVIGDVATDPRTQGNVEALLAIGVRVLVNLPIIEHGQLVAVAFVHHDRPHDWIEGELNFVRAVGDRTQAAIAQLRAEEQQRLLNRELGHRLKNNLAMVQAIVAQTLRNAPDLAAARQSLSQRLATLGRAHELLLSGSIDGTDIAAIAHATLAIHDDGQGRLRISGAPTEIGSAAALSLALMLHELATNAAKYGALSVPEGQVALEWTIAPRDEEGAERLVLLWTERGGPPVRPPERRGFGSRLIERGLAGATGGEVELDYRPEGLVCRMSVPLAGLQRDG